MYLEALRLLNDHLGTAGMPQVAASITREHVEDFDADQRVRWAPATASIRFRSLQAFFRWAVEEGEVAVNPMRNMKPVPVGGSTRLWPNGQDADPWAT